jgi:hypothetical protein
MCESRQSDDALPIGLPQSDYLAHQSIMFMTRPNALHSAFRVAGFVRAGLTALPQIIQPRCDSLRYPVTSRLCGSYFLSDRTISTAHSTVKANASQT